MTVYEKAKLLISATTNELLLGTKHYRESTGQPLFSVKEILIAMKDKDLIIEPTPERQHIFRQTKRNLK